MLATHNIKAAVVPASAGVIPMPQYKLVYKAGRSRVSGGDPYQPDELREIVESFPRQRG